MKVLNEHVDWTQGGGYKRKKERERESCKARGEAREWKAMVGQNALQGGKA